VLDHITAKHDVKRTARAAFVFYNINAHNVIDSVLSEIPYGLLVDVYSNDV
jgi:hypothetical protein